MILAPNSRLLLLDAIKPPPGTDGCVDCLAIGARCDVIPREGRPALFSIWTLSRRVVPRALSTLTIRDAEGKRTAEAVGLSEFSGFGKTGN